MSLDGTALVIVIVGAILAIGAAAGIGFRAGYRAGRKQRAAPVDESPSASPSVPPSTAHDPVHVPSLLNSADIQNLLDMMPVNMFFKDQTGELIWVNRALIEATGIPQDQWVGEVTMSVSGEGQEKFRRDDEYVFNTAQPCLNIIDRYRGADGPRWARTDKLPLIGQDGEVVGLVGIAMDITEQVQAEQQLESERQLIADLLNVVPIGICLNDENGRYVMVNDAYCQTYNFTRAEIIGQHFSAIMPPGEGEKAEAHYAQMLSGDLGIPVERKRQRSDGSIIYIEAANGLLVRRDGRKYVATVVRDITQRKEAEVERELMIQDLNAYAHMVAHDLKNPLAVVMGFSNVLREDMNTMSDEDFDVSLNAIESAGHKMLAIIDELLLLAHVRRQHVQVEPIEMGLVVKAAQERLSWLIAASDPEIIVPSSWPPALGYASWLEEVWANYISNAIKYGGASPRIELGATPVGDVVQFWVRDNGPGIPADQLDKLFMPFTRLDQIKKVEGHGLGLSIVRRVVEQLGGEVGVESEVGQGSTFTFTLPHVS